MFSITLLAWLINEIVPKLEHCCKSPFFGIGISTARLQSSGIFPVCHMFTISLCSKDIPKSPLALVISALCISLHPVAVPFLSCFSTNSTSDLRKQHHV